MSQSNVGQEFSKQLQQKSTPGPVSLRRMATNLLRSLIRRLLPGSEGYPMTEDTIYVEAVERQGFPTLFFAYVRGAVDSFETVEDCIEFLVEKEVPGDSHAWAYLEPYAEAGL